MHNEKHTHVKRTIADMIFLILGCAIGAFSTTAVMIPNGLTCGGLTLNEQEHTVSVNGQRVELTYKEYELLRLFLTHPRTAFTRDKLMEVLL